MAVYLVGDIQGCDEALTRLLQAVDFSPSRDHLIGLGDLVNRGPNSLAVLRRFVAWEGSADAVLGNHDLHALAVHAGVRRSSRMDTLGELLEADDALPLMRWLQDRPLAMHTHGILLVHAGVLPQWTLQQVMTLAHEVKQVLRGPDLTNFLAQMYGNTPDTWDESLQGTQRWRVVVNALTRLRFCTVQGRMDFDSKEGADGAPEGFLPWFEVPGRQTSQVDVAFGHWSTLGEVSTAHVWALDTGCVWGGQLTVLRVSADGRHERIAVDCPQAQKPGR